MSSLVKTLLNGITSTTSTKLEGKEIKMFNFTTTVPLLDLENERLFRASELLQGLGNLPGLTAKDFYDELMTSQHPVEEHESLTLAAIAIETMLAVGLEPVDSKEPTVH